MIVQFFIQIANIIVIIIIIIITYILRYSGYGYRTTGMDRQWRKTGAVSRIVLHSTHTAQYALRSDRSCMRRRYIRIQLPAHTAQKGANNQKGAVCGGHV